MPGPGGPSGPAPRRKAGLTGMAGYSGPPLPVKLGLRPGFWVELVGLPVDVRRRLAEALAECHVVSEPDQLRDLVLVFARSRVELARAAARAGGSLAPAGAFWAAWPKRSSGVSTELHESIVRDVGLSVGLVDVKICAISETWSGLKFVRRRKDRGRPAPPAARSRNARPR